MADKEKTANVKTPETTPVTAEVVDKVEVAGPSERELRMIQDFEARMSRMDQAIKMQQATIEGLRKEAGQSVGQIDRAHCNLCGADVDELGIPVCGHAELVNHIGTGNRRMHNGDVELVLVRQDQAS